MAELRALYLMFRHAPAAIIYGRFESEGDSASTRRVVRSSSWDCFRRAPASKAVRRGPRASAVPFQVGKPRAGDFVIQLISHTPGHKCSAIQHLAAGRWARGGGTQIAAKKTSILALPPSCLRLPHKLHCLQVISGAECGKNATAAIALDSSSLLFAAECRANTGIIWRILVLIRHTRNRPSSRRSHFRAWDCIPERR